jgi:oligopeptide/dipeptide ABC transporter ATP-binding protein
VPLLRVEGLRKAFHRRSGAKVHAVNDVSFDIEAGETLGLIGESGSGKSTVGRLVLRLIEADDGQITFDGEEVRTLDRDDLRRLRRRMQIVFQEPLESLNPRMKVGEIVGEPLRIHEPGLNRREREERVEQVLDEVGLNASFARRYPRALSGGQQQRIGIARAIITRPRFIVLGEPTSSLDLSVRAQILELLQDLQDKHALAYLFISHDLATVGYISHRIAVMYLGQIRELGLAQEVVERPRGPYAQALLSAALSVDPDQRNPYVPLEGEIPSPTRLPEGCFLYQRCPVRINECRTSSTPLRSIGGGHEVRCIRVSEDINEDPVAALIEEGVPPAAQDVAETIDLP